MGRTRRDEFGKDAVGIALTCGLTRKQIADDLGVGIDAEQIDHCAPRY
jgi:transposase